ncbi:unnamed protein product [Prunus brigantina]
MDCFASLIVCRILYIYGILIQDTTYVVAIGFGFRRGGNDHKVVRVMRFACKENMFGVEVYSLKLNALEKN